MAALTADDVTVQLLPENVDFTHSLRKFNLVSIAFGDGSKTYPSGGVPLPDKTSFGMTREIAAMLLLPPSNGYVYRYDRANHKVRVFFCNYDAAADGPLAEVDTSHAPAATTLEALVLGE
ncbi:MAG: hypothetical protein K6T61_18330 [Bryobacteraceae bacterium]|nr:hypothetical protein [Bryobacteraceae bacterium]